MKAMFDNVVVAESNDTVMIEGNHYFPADSVKPEFLHGSSTHTVCPWKGVASYYSFEIGKEKIDDGAWFYPNPSAAAAEIKGHVAFGDDFDIVE